MVVRRLQQEILFGVPGDQRDRQQIEIDSK